MRWVCYEYQHPGDEEATQAIAKLRASLCGAGGWACVACWAP